MARSVFGRRPGSSFALSVVLTVVLLAGCGGGGGDTAVSGTDPAAVAGVRITPESRQIAVTGTTQLTAQALDAGGAVLSGHVFSFSTSNPAVATVTDPAANPVTVTGVADGVATITAATAGQRGTAVVTVAGRPDIQFSGRVIDGVTEQGLAGASVELRNGATATTAADGSYSVLVPASETLVTLTARLPNYVSTQLVVPYAPRATTLEPILLVRESSFPGSISGALRNATDNDPIVGATVVLMRGQSGSSVDQVGQRTTDSNGGFSFTALPAGTYSLLANPEGFGDCRRTAIAIADGIDRIQNLTCSKSGQIRVVLTWGSEPEDLDAHLTGPNVSDAGRFHVYWPNGSRGSTDAAPFAKLDLDDTSGAGPETVTIGQLNSGVYRYSVHDFTNARKAASTALGSSGAKVELYTGAGPTPEVFFVPNQPGTLWTVFELIGSPSGPTLTILNQMGIAADPAAVN